MGHNMSGQLARLRRHPHRMVAQLGRDLAGEGIAVTLAHHSRTLTVLHVAFDPPPAQQLPGYPAEQARINIRPDDQIGAVPIGDRDRRWYHRFPHLNLHQLISHPTVQLTWTKLTGPLCLEYPLDPPHLRWQWCDGLDVYIRIVQRHLWSEEYWRRHGHWPVEDAPHDTPADGTAYPILTPHLRSAS
jgi:hypothetical protein